MRAVRGLSVFSALLALGLAGAMLLVAMRYAEDWSHARRHAAAARDLVVLARAARAHAANALHGMREAARTHGGMSEIAVATIEARGWLSPGFPTTNALGQSYRVFHRSVGTDGLDVLVTTVTPAEIDVGYRLDAGYEGAGDIFVGVVDALEPQRLRGPALDAEVEPYQSAFGEPSVGETGAIAGLTRRSVYGSELHRTAVEDYSKANEMETDLRMGGHDVRGAGDIKMVTATVADELEVLGGLKVTETLTVGHHLRVYGQGTFSGNLTATEGSFDVLDSNSGKVQEEILARSIEVRDDVDASIIRATSAIAAPTVSTTDLHAENVVANEIRSDEIVAHEVRSRLVRGGTVEGETGIFREIVTGGCTGC